LDNDSKSITKIFGKNLKIFENYLKGIRKGFKNYEEFIRNEF